MNKSLVSTLLAAALGTLAFAPSAQAGTIINVQGFTNGSTGSGEAGAYTFAVGEAVQFTNPVTLNLAAGDYTVSNAAGKPGATFDAWDFQNGADGSWTTHFWVGTAIFDTPNFSLLLDGMATPGTGHYGGYFSEAEATAAFTNYGSFTFHLDTDSVVGFIDPDYDLFDNTGGVSLEIDRVGAPSAVPEPANVLMLLAGLGGLAGLARRRASARPHGRIMVKRTSPCSLSTLDATHRAISPKITNSPDAWEGLRSPSNVAN